MNEDLTRSVEKAVQQGAQGLPVNLFALYRCLDGLGAFKAYGDSKEDKEAAIDEYFKRYYVPDTGPTKYHFKDLIRALKDKL